MSESAPGFAKYPDYQVDAQAIRGELLIELDGAVLCRSRKAVWVNETRHAPALYVPRADVAADALVTSNTSTYCPFKGTASYHHVAAGGAEPVNDVFWYYPEPYSEVLFLADYLGLYQDRVSRILIDGKELPSA